MLFLQVKLVTLAYTFTKEGKVTSLWLDGAPTERIRVSTGTFLQEPISVVISSDTRDHPHKVGSLHFLEADGDAPANTELWLHANNEEVEAICHGCSEFKYTYISVTDASVIGSGEWRLERGNPVKVLSYSFSASHKPPFGQGTGS